MEFGYLKLVVALAVVGGVCSVPLGCRDDSGKLYREGEAVQAGEPCLSCVCRNGALSCSLRVCADYVEALPRGCFLVHKPDDCCPQLFCEGGFGPNGIELRTAGKAMEGKVEGNGCVINGTVYGEGSAVASWDPCEYCYCTEGGIKCVKPRCAQPFEGCRAMHEKFSCCPTHFDCRDAKVSFLKPRVKHIVREVSGTQDWQIPKDPLRSLAETDSELDKENANASLREGSSTAPPEEETAEDLAVATTEEINTEGTTSDDQPETTTSSSSDYPTTLGLQTTEVRNLRKESSAVGWTEETTPGVTTQALDGTSEGGSEGSGVGSEKPGDMEEDVGSRWNSSQSAEDYDAYDYGEPKLPPSLPNLVIFPFVAADAVVKDERAEPYEEVQVERIDDQAVVFKDYFSPPTRTEGGFVPKQPSPEPFYELPFLMKEPTEQPIESLTERKQTVPQINAPPQVPNEPASSSFDDDQRTDLALEGILGDGGKSPVQSGPFDQVTQTEMASGFFLRGNSDPFRKSQQTKKPVTVAYKNVVVDFYPDHLVTTTRTRLTTQSGARTAAADSSPQPQQWNSTTPVSFIVPPHSLIVSHEETTSAPATATQHLPPREPAPTSTTRESSFFDQFLKSFLTEENTQSVTALTTGNKHKYSSKIKSRISTTGKPKREDGAESVQLEIATDAQTFPSLVAGPGGPSAALHLGDGPQRAKEGPRHSLTTTSPIPSEIDDLSSPEPTVLGGGRRGENELRDDPDEGPARIRPGPGTLLKLAGCNIYGMMYRIGKVIAELSGPCVECLCTDIGVQCRALECSSPPPSAASAAAHFVSTTPNIRMRFGQ